jgi:hypothetical protein
MVISSKQREILSTRMLGENNPNYGKRGAETANWKGGKIIRNGYIMIKVNEHPPANYGGYVQEHRLIMEKYLGRQLTENELVHHINGNKAECYHVKEAIKRINEGTIKENE